MNTRIIAARVINEVTDGRSLTDALSHHLANLKEARDRAFVQAICFGVCRFYTRLDVVLSHLLQRPMNEKDSDVHALIMVGLYQLMEMRVPEHAAVSETVNASEKLQKPWARGFINAILRSYLREKDNLVKEIETDDEALYAHPYWWIQAVKKAWPNEWQAILTANNSHPPFSLRVNLAQQTREAYLDKITAWAASQGEDAAAAVAITETESGIVLTKPVIADELPGFAKSEVSVQDGAAQLAAELLQLAKGQRILDACVAPGGKLMHILEREPGFAAVVAVEKDASRMKQVEDNLQRAGFEKVAADESEAISNEASWVPVQGGKERLSWADGATLKTICSDVNDLSAWWDDQPFDRILLDAPCSASGVIRRHPDIKLLRQPADMQNFASEQQALLRTLWQTLKSGGVLVYATCSIFPEENMATIQKFLATHDDASEIKIDASWGVACEVGRQILPGQHNMDGFYFARLMKA